MIPLPRLGMGCAGLGNLYRPVDERVADETIAAALAGGVRFFDVAPHYGFGLAEERLGRGLAGASDVIVSTKVGRVLEPTESRAAERHGFVAARPYEPTFDYSRDGVLRSVEASLKRLGRDRVDLLLAHDLGTVTHGAEAGRRLAEFLDGGYQALVELRDQGVTRAIGLGVNEVAVCDELLDHVPLDAILLAGRYTLLEQEDALPLLDRCRQAGTAVIVGGPYNSGILVEGSRAASHFDYAPPPPAVVARVAELEAACARFDTPLPAAALQLPLRHPAVASVIPGMVGAEQVAASIAYVARPIPAGLWDAVRPVGAREEAA